MEKININSLVKLYEKRFYGKVYISIWKWFLLKFFMKRYNTSADKIKTALKHMLDVDIYFVENKGLGIDGRIILEKLPNIVMYRWTTKNKFFHSFLLFKEIDKRINYFIPVQNQKTWDEKDYEGKPYPLIFFPIVKIYFAEVMKNDTYRV